ncbi:XRE family transcriptional regulator [Helicobacter muridarum]|uniref:Predicted transcriptional regulator n=1 Tax=Helicobacter muridarum TaxID=216 RepID=A0A099U042_9HELI|nr:helix-turn-helix domain-containing protein [Helicobacter muridarum]TLD98802.1 XRE family transcriptional regulator [Helicobacter muridarum]STQ85780.1 Predicted transcriptional regulator [Helicobacter muridarum]
MKIDNKLREIRDSLGIKQNQFAHDLDIPLQTYIRYEHNKREVPSGVMKKISDKYGVDFNAFYNGVIEGNNNIQVVGCNNKIPNAKDDELEEIFQLIKDYAPPKMIKDIKEKLLKIKDSYGD